MDTGRDGILSHVNAIKSTSRRFFIHQTVHVGSQGRIYFHYGNLKFDFVDDKASLRQVWSLHSFYEEILCGVRHSVHELQWGVGRYLTFCGEEI